MDLTDEVAAVLGLIVAAPLARSLTDAITGAGHDARLLESLRARDLVGPWDLPDGRHWTLRPLACEILSVTLVTAPSGT